MNEIYRGNFGNEDWGNVDRGEDAGGGCFDASASAPCILPRRLLYRQFHIKYSVALSIKIHIISVSKTTPIETAQKELAVRDFELWEAAGAGRVSGGTLAFEGALQAVSEKDMVYQDEKPDYRSGFSDS